MYDDFKNRVCEGRGIHRDVIDLIAGGRVMTGLKAFTLNAPEELIRQIKGLDVPPAVKKVAESSAKIEEIVEAPVGKKEEVIIASPLEKTEGGAVASAPAAPTSPSTVDEPKPSNNANIVVINEDQETSPFAPPEFADAESTTVAASLAATPSATEVDPAQANADAALATSTAEELAPVAKSTSGAPGSIQSASGGIYQVTPGPFGRGLIDGIGGIRDAAVYACELFVSAR